MPAQCALEPVEVPGWDAEGQFFVEITGLDLHDSGDTAVRLCHRVHSGSPVFVRLLHGEGDGTCEKGCSTANEAHSAEPPDFTGRSCVRWIPCPPRGARRHVTGRAQPASK
jgi:hypothetical protein